MPSEVIRNGGSFNMPLPPLDQIAVEPASLSELMTFEYPPVHGDAYDIGAFVRQQWEPRKSLLNSVYLRLTQARNTHPIQLEHLTVPAGVLHWLAMYEEWLTLSFLRGGIKSIGHAHAQAHGQGLQARCAIIDNLSRIHGDVFDTLRGYLMTCHYTHELEEDPTALPLTHYELYIAPTDLIISAINSQECKAHRRNGNRDLLWWDHRRVILREGDEEQKDAQWLAQNKEEMEGLAARYPVPGSLSERPFMMPAVTFR